jgi:hypothetical protein
VIARLADSAKRDPVIWLTGLASLALLVYMNVHHGPLFSRLALGRTIPDSDFSATPDSLLSLRQMLETRPEAADTLYAMHLVPDMALPGLLAAFLFLLLRRLMAGATLYGRPAEQLEPVLLLLPVLYAVADYSENAASFLFFPPSTPSQASLATLSVAIYWATRLKFLFATVSVLVIIRLAIAKASRSTG